MSHDGVDADDVTEIVWVAHGQVVVNVERREGSTRYRLLETIRAVAGGYCEDAGDAVSTRAALGERYLADFPFATGSTGRGGRGCGSTGDARRADRPPHRRWRGRGRSRARSAQPRGHLGEQSTAEAVRMLLRVIDASRRSAEARSASRAQRRSCSPREEIRPVPLRTSRAVGGMSSSSVPRTRSARRSRPAPTRSCACATVPKRPPERRGGGAGRSGAAKEFDEAWRSLGGPRRRRRTAFGQEGSGRDSQVGGCRRGGAR